MKMLTWPRVSTASRPVRNRYNISLLIALQKSNAQRKTWCMGPSDNIRVIYDPGAAVEEAGSNVTLMKVRSKVTG